MTKNEDSHRVLKTALRYKKELNFSVIPVRPDNKKPFIKWAEYQKKRATREEIIQWFTQYPDAMIGIVTGEISGIMVVDCDDEISYKKIQESLNELVETWIAKTPRGYHIYFKYPDRPVSNAASIIDKVDIRAEGGYIIASPSVKSNGETYSWIASPDKYNLASIPEEFSNNYNIYNSFYRGGVVNGENQSQQTSTLTTNDNTDNNFFSKGRRDNDLFHLANCMIKGGCDPSFATQALEIVGRNINPPFPENEIKTKIESALKRSANKERNLTSEIRDWVLTTDGIFLTTDVYMEQQLTTRHEKKCANVVLRRLCEGPEPLLERYGQKRGCYRKIENNVEVVNFLTAPTDEFKVRWPLEIEDLCTIYPGNIIIVAGSKSSGKTGFLLNVAKLNMNHHEVVYLNSEMGDTEFRKRLELFGEPKLQDWKIKAYHRSSNFADLITPEKKIFIVDFLEVTTDFWKVAQYIQEIHKKLKNGICVIGLQKSDNKETGRGGDFSKEKARLYIGLDYIADEKVNRAKIVDAKAWRGERNPRGLVREYKLAKGSKFFPMGGWRDS